MPLIEAHRIEHNKHLDLKAVAAMNETTPAELGVRSVLLVDKHAEYIRSFSKLWEVRSGVCGHRSCAAADVYQSRGTGEVMVGT